jgi:hypothetical protein
MGRKHKSNSIKYIKRSNDNLRQENESLKQMTNYAMARNLETQNKATMLENYIPRTPAWLPRGGFDIVL